MVRYKHLTFLSLLILMMSFGFVTAANTQSLEWGVEITDRFDYTLNYVQDVPDNPQGSWDIYVAILDLPTIPDTVTSWPQLSGASDATPFYFANGTLIYEVIPWNFLAIGNWSFVTELYTAQSNNTITDTASEWGYTHETPYSGGTQTVEILYSKTDGVMNFYERITTNADGEVFDSLTIIRDGYFRGLGSIDPLMLLIIGGVAVGLVVVIIVIRKR